RVSPPRSRSSTRMLVSYIPHRRFLWCRVTSRVGDDDVCGFFSDHVNGADDEQARRARKDRRVDDAQPFGAVDLEIARQHAAARLRADGTRARRVMAPCLVLD